MKLFTALVVALTVSQPQPDAFQEADQRLQGTWRSDRDKTMVSVENSSRITPARRETLERDVGEMALIFERGKTAVKLDEFISDYYNYSILNYENDAIMLSIGPLLHKVKASYTFEDDCIYMRDATQDYREYFCSEQKKQMQEQQTQAQAQAQAQKKEPPLLAGR